MRASVTSLCVVVTLAIGGGCFPYFENVRSDISGRLVDDTGRPVANATVRACSASRWVGMRHCKVEESVVTDDQGRFAFGAETALDWCCLGEAPLYQTELSVCTDDGRHAMSLVGSSADELTLTTTPPDDERCEEIPTFRPSRRH